MQLTLVDINADAFYPFTETRPISELFVVGGSIAHHWSTFLPNVDIRYACAESLKALYPQNTSDDCFCVDSRVVPNAAFALQVEKLRVGEGLLHNNQVVAVRLNEALGASKLSSLSSLQELSDTLVYREFTEELIVLNDANDLFQKLGSMFKYGMFNANEFDQKTDGLIGVFHTGNQLFVHANATLQPGFYDTSDGPIIVDDGAMVMAGSMLKGPIYIGKGAVVKMGAKIYGPTVIGNECRVGGEVTNCNMFPYSNKGHDGFIGNAVIGEWCNLGADTNCSNLKNNYSKVKQYQKSTGSIEATSLQFCGVLMGDHSKTAINTQINTASVFGAFSNVVSSDFPPKHLPNFSWFSNKGLEPFAIEKAYEMAETMMARRNVSLSGETKELWRFLAQ